MEPKLVSTVRATCPFDESESRRIVDEVQSQRERGAKLIVISLADVRTFHWSAVCRLASAMRAWRGSRCNVVLETRRSTQRALIASAAGGEMWLAASGN